MRMYDCIEKKKEGKALTTEEIRFMVKGFTDGVIPDYQMSAMLMAICFRGMDRQETVDLTLAMRDSGSVLDLSSIPGIKVDKHSTGGVGDKTSLVLTPIVAALGVPVAKMSGRGLGHTGGTIDKLECFPGFTTELSREKFMQNVTEIGVAIAGQTANLAPADKRLYALRDVTATVDEMSLIASSIMSKKLASGSDAIVLDVKTGNGAFMKTLEDSIRLAQAMVAIGTHNGRKVAALITDMDTPLGYNIGNSLEVIESVAVLKGHGPADLTEVCYQLAANMLLLAGKGTLPECRKMAEEAVASGAAYEKLKQMFAAQGGDISVLDDPNKFAKAHYSREIRADQGGWLYATNTEMIGNASVLLGAGRIKKEDSIDFAAGIVLHKKAGDRVEPGDLLATFYAEQEAKFAPAEEMYRAALTFRDEKPVLPELVMARVTEEGVERF